MALDEERKARRTLAVDRGPCACTAKAERLAQQHDRANGGRLQISLRPLDSSEASCTIHCTSSSIVVARERVLGCRLGCRSKGPFPEGRSSKRKSATAHAPAAKRTCAASVNLRTSW